MLLLRQTAAFDRDGAAKVKARSGERDGFQMTPLLCSSVRAWRSIRHIGLKAADSLLLQQNADQWQQCGVVSTGRRNTRIKSFCWCFVSQRFPWSLVELSRDGTQLCLTMYRQIGAFWKVLSQETVGIFNRAALPRTVWVA